MQAINVIVQYNGGFLPNVLHLREQDGDHVHADPARTGNEDSLQRHGATVPSDNLLHLLGRHSD